jgi:anthranilate synthase component 1
MTTSPKTHPFGEPAFAVRPVVTRLSLARCAPSHEVYARLRALGPDRAIGLFESLGPHLPTTRRSLIAARGLARVELRSGVATITALDPAGLPILDAIAERQDAQREGETLTIDAHEPASTEHFSDAERLAAPSSLDILRHLAGLLADTEPAPLPPGIFGAFAHDLVDRFDALPPRKPDPLGDPDASFVLATDLVLYDHGTNHAHVVTRGLPMEPVGAADERHAEVLELLRGEQDVLGQLPPALSFEPDEHAVDDPADFLAGVAALRDNIHAGDVFQAVLARRFELRGPADDLAVYRELRRRNPSPYHFHLNLGKGSLFGASPETFLRVEDGVVEIRPIAGTVPRGFAADGSINPDTDRRLALQLLLDPKEQAEHAMLLDLARNDVARISEPGSMHTTEQFQIEKYSHVQHLVSRVKGDLSAGHDALHAYRAVANMGTLTGAPKLRAIELVRELEPTSRGFYGGAAGFLLADGSFDSCIVIRSLRQVGGTYSTSAGAGVVHDSTPERELAETSHKARSSIEAVLAAGNSTTTRGDGA